MKGETFFEALGKIDKKYTKSAESRFIKSEKRERSATAARIFYYVGTAAALIAVILAIWIPSRLFRDKPVEPSVSDTDTAVSTDAVTSDEIQTNEPVTETETAPETDPVTEPVTDTEADAPGPITDEEIIAALVDDLAANGYDADKWQRLTSYGSIAFDQLIKQYYRGALALDAAHRTVISCFAADYLRDEIGSAEGTIFEGLKLPDPVTGLSDESNASWLYDYSTKVTSVAKATEELEFAERLPKAHRFMDLRNFGHMFPFTPEKNTGAGCVDVYVKYKSAKTNETVTNKISDYFKSYSYSSAPSGVRAEAAAYCAVKYRTETDPTVRSLYGWLFCLAAREDVTPIAGSEYAHALLYDKAHYFIYEHEIWDYIERFEPVIGEFIPLAENFMANYPKKQAEADHPITCAALDALGFDGYKPGEPDIAFRARNTVKEALELANALCYGIGRHDGTSVYYKDPDDPSTPDYPAALAEAIKNNGIDYYEGLSTQAEGFKTADEWKRYYKSILSDSIVDKAIRSTNFFVIADGIVYTSNEMWEGIYEIDLTGLKVTGEKNGVSTLSVNIMIPWGMGHYEQEVTFEVTEDKNGIKIVGGTFVEIFLEPGTTKGKAALTVFELLRIKAMLIDGEGGFEEFQGYQEPKTLHTQEELIKFYKDWYYASDPPVLSDDAFPIYAHNGWDSDDSWECMIKGVLPEEYYDILITFNGRVINAGSYILIKAGEGTGAAPVIGPVNGLTLTDVYNAIKVKSNKNGKMTVSLDFNAKENGAAKTVTYTFEIDGSRLTGGTFKEEFFDFQKAVNPAKLTASVLDAFRSRYVVDPADVFDMSDPAGCNAPQVLIDAVNENFGESGKDQIYHRYNGLFVLSYLRNTAARFFTDDVLTRLFDDNRKMFVEGDRVLYINADILNFKNIGVTKATLKKTGENKYEIDVSLIDNGEQTPSVQTYTAKIQITSGKVVVAGGTFLDFIFEKMLAK